MKLGLGGTTRWRSLVYHVDVLRLAHCILGVLGMEAWAGPGATAQWRASCDTGARRDLKT